MTTPGTWQQLRQQGRGGDDPTPTTGLVVQVLTAGILSTGMAACETSAVSTFRGMSRRTLVRKTHFQVCR